MMRHTVIVLLLSFVCIFQLNAEGLCFRSYEVNKDYRTSLDISSEKQYDLEDGFTLSFDLRLRREAHNYGYIMRMAIGEKNNLDLIASSSPANRQFFLVTSGEEQLTLPQGGPSSEEGWKQVTITYTKEERLIHFKIGEFEQSIKVSDTFSFKGKSKIFFGANQHPLVATTDVAPMTLRNIHLTTHNKTYHWKLYKHGLKEVFDENHHLSAKVVYPLWLIDEQAKWKQVATIKIPQRHFWAFNESQSELYIVGPEHIYLFNLKHNILTDTITPLSGSSFHSDASQLIYDKQTHRLISYEIDSLQVEVFNFDSQRWRSKHLTPSVPKYWHHNHFISGIQNDLYCFGGYGFHKYKSILHTYSFKNRAWSQKDLSLQIAPRYLSALGQSNNKIYIFGGYGSKSGEQQFSPQFYYDLFELDISNERVNKIWEYQNHGENFVQGNSMIMDEKNNCFYTLCYSSEKYHSSIYLNQFNFKSSTRTILADSIPFLFNDTESMCDLVLDSNNQKLVAITLMPASNNQYEIKIHTLNYPPLWPEDVFQPSISTPLMRYVWWTLLIVISLGIVAGIFHKKRNKASILNLENSSEQTGSLLSPSSQSDIALPIEEKHSCITFIGGFQVIGKDGNDITGNFTPTLKNLLVLILLNTISKKKGLSSEMLTECFWFDKSDSSARNNLSVNIKRLRSLLEQVGDIQVIHSNGYWTIQLSDLIICDYKSLWQQMQIIKSKPDGFTEQEMKALLANVSKGSLLPSIQNEWIDNYKSEYTTLVIDALHLIFDEKKNKYSDEVKLKICDVILLLDSLDEDALIEKCRLLYAMGRKGIAKKAYDLYCKNYYSLLNANFKMTFEDIIGLKHIG